MGLTADETGALIKSQHLAVLFSLPLVLLTKECFPHYLLFKISFKLCSSALSKSLHENINLFLNCSTRAPPTATVVPMNSGYGAHSAEATTVAALDTAQWCEEAILPMVVIKCHRSGCFHSSGATQNPKNLKCIIEQSQGCRINN